MDSEIADLPSHAQNLERLRRFLEVHAKTRILNADPGTVQMYILHCKNNIKGRKMDDTITYLLLRFKECCLDRSPSPRDRVVAEFLIEELNKFYRELS